MKENRVYSYRFMWRLKGSDNINFKIITDTKAGIADFEDKIKQLPELHSAAKEYINEYDIELICKADTFYHIPEVKNEKSANK